MVEPKKRNMKRRYSRSPGGRIKLHFGKRKSSKHACALCGKTMHGMLHGAGISEAHNAPKTAKRPSALLSGALCNKCRAIATEEAIKVKHGITQIGEIDLSFRKYVEMVLKRIE